MNKEQDNQSLLVDQDDALGVYFDSLLLSDEIEFLDDVQDSPVSQSPVIVFSEKDKEGKINEQLLIPRSQRLAQENKTHTRPAPVSKTMQKSAVIRTRMASASALDIDDSRHREKSRQNNIQDDTGSLADKLSKSVPQPSQIKEAPELDLSLFLPKIKTLTDDEIRQQLETLTQAAVSQAQVETELQQLSQYEKFKQQTQQGDSETLIKNINNAPDWAIPEFQVLLFAVSGLKLAIPLSELNGIVEWGAEYISEMPGHASWYLGLIQHQGSNVPVIDTLQQVVPKQRWPSQYLQNPQFKHIILIANGQWGLACEKVLEVVTLKTDQVKWRSSRTKRRWLLGTVIDQMCALLDSAEFASMLATGEDSLIDER